MHAVKGSQNGYDNSGQSNRTKWLSENVFNHLAIGEWMGEFDLLHLHYKSIDQDNIDWAVDTIQGLLTEWGDHEALYAIEPVNEPWFFSHISTLFSFYRDVRAMMKEQ